MRTNQFDINSNRRRTYASVVHVVLEAEVEHAVFRGWQHERNAAHALSRETREVRVILLDEQPHDAIAIVVVVLFVLQLLLSGPSKSDRVVKLAMAYNTVL